MVNNVTNLEKAKNILESNKYTLVLVSDKDIQTDTLRGVRPLLGRYGRDFSEYSAADKVIGKGAAFLYVLLGIKKIYVRTISKPALDVLLKNDIHVEYDLLVNNIFNHDKTGFCPIETATMNISSPEEALSVIKETLKGLKD